MWRCGDAAHLLVAAHFIAARFAASLDQHITI
jgi:hypothetical protein